MGKLKDGFWSQSKNHIVLFSGRKSLDIWMIRSGLNPDMNIIIRINGPADSFKAKRTGNCQSKIGISDCAGYILWIKTIILNMS